ncbi:hypothetical protein DEO72_LG8g1256 [Vigna unguiculata]|uniref:Uncharacterized protein n=1 Tax=Vigna unguiculata TaxID=3917 RepID=A0A4D6MRM1_VIGUN|nr:hypothetical protein DEO72_LG8g1256 [Vigna unguiculata]
MVFCFSFKPTGAYNSFLPRFSGPGAYKSIQISNSRIVEVQRHCSSFSSKVSDFSRCQPLFSVSIKPPACLILQSQRHLLAGKPPLLAKTEKYVWVDIQGAATLRKVLGKSTVFVFVEQRARWLLWRDSWTSDEDGEVAAGEDCHREKVDEACGRDWIGHWIFSGNDSSPPFPFLQPQT